MDMPAPLDRSLQAAVATGSLHALVAVAGDAAGTLFQAAYGPAGITVDSVVWLASMTKAITSVAALQLVEQGRLHLDAPLGPLLPQLVAPLVLEGLAADGAPNLRPARGAITLRHLLTHTAGFGYDIWSEELRRYVDLTGAARTATPLIFDPGTRWCYGINTDLVGQAVAAASGVTLETYVATHITGPLGMRDTGFRLTPDQRARLMPRCLRAPDGRLTEVAFEPDPSPAVFGGGGGMYGTAPDYLRFARTILLGGTLDGAQILRPETVAAMARNQIGPLRATRLITARPDLSNDADFFPGMAQQFGFGFLLNTQPGPDGRAAFSLAWGGLANTYYWIDPTAGVCGIFATQVLPFADPVALACLGALERAVYRRQVATDEY